MVKNAKKHCKIKKLDLRVMFQDEARFGRISDPKKCWAPPGVRPRVPDQRVREYTYGYGAVSPMDGQSDFLILPAVTAEAMNQFLGVVSERHLSECILMLWDGAGGHVSNDLAIPDNIVLEKLPAYCPELNPVESIWDEMREKFFANRVFDSMAAVEKRLAEAMIHLEKHPKTVQSITGFKWIIDALKQ